MIGKLKSRGLAILLASIMSVSSISYNTEFSSLKVYAQEQMGSKAYSEILSIEGDIIKITDNCKYTISKRSFSKDNTVYEYSQTLNDYMENLETNIQNLDMESTLEDIDYLNNNLSLTNSYIEILINRVSNYVKNLSGDSSEITSVDLSNQLIKLAEETLKQLKLAENELDNYIDKYYGNDEFYGYFITKVDYNGGKTLDGQTGYSYKAKEGDMIELIDPNDVIKPGYKFKEWTSDIGDIEDNKIQCYSGNNDVLLIWEKANDVTVKLEETTTALIKMAYKGELNLNKYNKPTKTGYKFIGWECSSGYTKWNETTNSWVYVNTGENAVLTPIFEKNIINIKINNGNVVNIPISLDDSNKELDLKPYTIEKEGYKFDHWECTTGEILGTKSSGYKYIHNNQDAELIAYYTKENSNIKETNSPTSTPKTEMNVTIRLGGIYTNSGINIITKKVDINKGKQLLFNMNIFSEYDRKRIKEFTVDYGGSCSIDSNEDVWFAPNGVYKENIDVSVVLQNTIDIPTVPPVSTVEPSSTPLVSKEPIIKESTVVEVQLDGGMFKNTKNEIATYNCNINEYTELFALDNIEKIGYKLESLSLKGNAEIKIENNIVKIKPISSDRIVIKAVWSSLNVEPSLSPSVSPSVTVSPTISPTVTPSIKPTATPSNNFGLIDLYRTSIKMGKGEKAKMPIKSRYSNIKYSSSNKKVATISANGMITCVGRGNTNITAELNGDKKVMKLTVTDAPKSIKINGKKTRTVKKGKSIKLSFKLSGGYSYRIIWSTSNSKVATVNSYGVVKGKKKGKATIKIKTYNGKTYKITVNVK